MGETLHEIGIADRQERPLLELPEEHGEPEAADRKRRREIEPVQLEVDAAMGEWEVVQKYEDQGWWRQPI